MKDLRKTHTNEDQNGLFVGEFIEPTAATTPKAVSYTDIGTQTNILEGNTNSSVTVRTLAEGRGVKRGSTNKSKSRCRKCGKEYALPDWVPFHVNTLPSKDTWTGRPQNRILRDREVN